MGHQRHLFERVYAIVWDGPPTVADVQQLLPDLKAAQRGAGEQLFMLSVVPPGVASPPDAEAREMVRKMTPEILAACDSVDVVFQGKGITHALIRTVVRGMFVASRMSSRAHLHDAVRPALARIASASGADLDRLIRAAREKGLEV